MSYDSDDKDMAKLTDDEDGSEPPGGLCDELTSEPATPTPTLGEDSGLTPSEEDPNKPQWPSMVDLNTRLRRVITSYQRNFKKEELKLAQKAKVFLQVVETTSTLRTVDLSTFIFEYWFLLDKILQT